MALQVRRAEENMSSSQFFTHPETTIVAVRPHSVRSRFWEHRTKTFFFFLQRAAVRTCANAQEKGVFSPLQTWTESSRANSKSFIKPGPLPSTPPPSLTHSPTSPGSGSTSRWLREIPGKAAQLVTPPKAQSWSTSFRSPAQTRLSHCVSRLWVVPPPPRYRRSLPHCTPGTASLHFS